MPNQQPASAGPFVFNLRFGGVTYYDVETGTLQNTYRDYSPGGGTYLQSDPIGLLAGPNTYAYVNGGPLSYVDPLGLEKVILFPPSSERQASLWGPDDPNICFVFGHGKPGVISSTTNPSDALSIEELKKRIQTECKPKQPVQLMSCYAGTGGDNSLAQQLSNALGVPVFGYDGYVVYQAPAYPFFGSVYPVPGVTNNDFYPRK